MRKNRFPHKVIIIISLIITFMISLFPFSTPAVSEKEVEAQVTARGREAVAGNLFIWLLCAVAFLKISQKIDSILSSLGVNAGNTGSSMIAELMLATRSIAMGGKIAGAGSSGSLGGRRSSGIPGPGGSGGGTERFLSGGLVGVVGRSLDKGATLAATGKSDGGVGGRLYAASVSSGGDYANNIIGSVARGDVASAGTITGENAVDAFKTYLGFKGQSQPNHFGAISEKPLFSDIEIGGGRIMGVETTDEYPDGIRFGMYDTERYMAPDGEQSIIQAADGSSWYKQYARDTVDRVPYMESDGTIAYTESVVSRLPDIPRRKDRI